MPDFCEECCFAKTAICPKCHEAFICGDCETECMGCYFKADSDEEHSLLEALADEDD